MCEDPMGAFSEAILNYHNHYQDIHTSEGCRFHQKVRQNYVYSKFKKIINKKVVSSLHLLSMSHFSIPLPPLDNEYSKD